MDDVKPETAPDAPDDPPKPDPPKSLVARLIEAGRAMQKRREDKRAARIAKAAEEPWWKRIIVRKTSYTQMMPASQRNDPDKRKARAEVRLKVHTPTEVRDEHGKLRPMTRAERKRRRREARERGAPI